MSAGVPVIARVSCAAECAAAKAELAQLQEVRGATGVKGVVWIDLVDTVPLQHDSTDLMELIVALLAHEARRCRIVLTAMSSRDGDFEQLQESAEFDGEFELLSTKELKNADVMADELHKEFLLHVSGRSALNGPSEPKSVLNGEEGECPPDEFVDCLRAALPGELWLHGLNIIPNQLIVSCSPCSDVWDTALARHKPGSACTAPPCASPSLFSLTCRAP